MSKYFTSVYKNYYDKISADKNIETNVNSLNDKLTSLDTATKTFINYFESSNWNEKGKLELINSYLPKIVKNTNILRNNVSYNMSKVVNLVKNDLYNLLVELKERDEEYCKLQDSIRNDYLEEEDLVYKKSKLELMESLIVNVVNNIDKKILEIKSYNSLELYESDDAVASLGSIDLKDKADQLLKLYKSTHDKDGNMSFIDKLKDKVEENKIKKMINGMDSYEESSNNEENDGKTEEVVTNPLDNPNCISLSLLDGNWKVVNTAIPVSEYATLAYNKGIRQNSNSARYGDLCLAFSYVHASNMANGETGDNAESAYNWKHAGEFYDYFSDNKQEVLSVVYNQVAQGRPVVLQVNGNKQGTSRHFVTVVGIKDGVTSADTVQESDLLILDSWDGQLERMDTNTSRFMTTGAQCNKSYSGYYLRIMK